MADDPNHRAKAYAQAADLQALLLTDALKLDTKPTVRAGLARAWILLEQLRRDIRGKRSHPSVKKKSPVVVIPTLDRATAQPVGPAPSAGPEQAA